MRRLSLALVLLAVLVHATACVGTAEQRADRADQAAGVVGTVGEVAGAFGGPGMLVKGVAGIAAGALAAYAESQRRAAKTERRKVQAVVRGAEKGPRAVKKAIRDAARDLGVSPELEADVAELARPEKPESSSGPHPKPTKKGRVRP